MKIGFFYPQYYPVTASGSIHGYQIAKGLVERGHTLLSLTTAQNPYCKKYPPTKFGMLKLLKDADIFYIRLVSFFEHVSIWKLLKPFSLPVIWEINAPIEERFAFQNDDHMAAKVKVLNRKRKFYAKFVDASICVSNTLKEYSNNFLKIKDSYYVSNGSDPLHFSPGISPAKCFDRLQNAFKVFWAGNPKMPWQALELMVNVCRRIEKIRNDVLFVFICSEKDVYPFPELDNILVLNRVNYMDMPKYLAAADLCLCLYNNYDWSKYGFYGSSLKLFDYMAAGKSTIASKMGQLEEVIDDGRNGFLVDNKVESLVDKILFLINQKDLLTQIGKNAREDIISYYNWERAVSQIEKIMLSKV